MGRSNATGQQPMLKSSIRLQSMLESTKSKSNFQIKTKRFQETSTSVAGSSADDGLIHWKSIVKDHGWVVSGHIAGPDSNHMQAVHVQRMHFILRTLRDQNLIPDKINNKWFFKNGGEPQKIATKELKMYMDASNHLEYITEFEAEKVKKVKKGFQIQVKTITGKTVTIEDVADNDTIAMIKKKISEKDGLPRDEQYLEYPKGRVASNDRTMKDLGIAKDATVWESGRLKGGMQQPPQDTS